MKLKEFLSLITDEDVRIELELDIYEERDYLYASFWLSDFRKGIPYGRKHPLIYKDWIVENISFDNVMDSTAEITIQIKEE